jgi:hypothetical protein
MPPCTPPAAWRSTSCATPRATSSASSAPGPDLFRLNADIRPTAILRWALEPELRRRPGRLAPARLDPARLDRHGLLWAATPEGWERARLPFEIPLTSPDQLPGAIHLLLSRAQTCCRERLAPRSADG